MLLRVREGLERQRDRLTQELQETPTHTVAMSDTGELATFYDFDGSARLDLDYYIVELYRLNAIADAGKRDFVHPEAVREAQECFAEGIPGLRDIRNRLMHPTAEKANDWAKFSFDVSLIDISGGIFDEQPMNTIGPHSEQHDLAMDLAEALRKDLRLGLLRLVETGELEVHQQYNWTRLIGKASPVCHTE